MKEFWKKTKDSFIVAGDMFSTQDRKIHDSEDIIIMLSKESKMQYNAESLLNLFLSFQRSIKLYFNSISELAEKYSGLLATSSHKVIAQEIANATSSLSKIATTMADIRIQQYCINPLVLFNNQCKTTLFLGQDRHEAYILKVKSDQSLERLRSKSTDYEKISNKIKKNKARNEAFQSADKAFREAYAKDCGDSDVFESTWKAFTYYIYQMNEELGIKFDHGVSAFPFDPFSPEFEPITSYDDQPATTNTQPATSYNQPLTSNNG